MEAACGRQPAAVGADQAAGTILVVEDDVLVRSVAADSLRDLGCTVVEAGSADEAMRLLNTGMAVDVIFSDIDMPGTTDGIGLAAWVRRHRPGTKFLLTSGLPHQPSQGEARDLDGLVVLAKPYRLDELARRISEMLQS